MNSDKKVKVCSDCSWCVINFDSGLIRGFVCSRHHPPFDVKLYDKCVLGY